MNRIDTLNRLFDQICERLYINSLNYCVNIKLYPCTSGAGKGVSELVKSALGESALLGGYRQVDSNEILDAVIENIKYEGDDGSHPNLSYLRSTAGHDAIEVIEQALNEFLNESKDLFSFWLKEGHPFYPVFWDYAYIIETDSGGVILIGCSSD